MRKNLRDLRSTAALDSLFSRTVQGVLALTLIRPEKWWYLSELAHRLGTTPSSVQRSTSSLVNAGILQTRRQGARTYFKARERSPIYEELRGIFEKSARAFSIARHRDGQERAVSHREVALNPNRVCSSHKTISRVSNGRKGIPHGTRSGYLDWGCKCKKCRAFYKIYRGEKYQRTGN